jgi:predicted SAM-dependent methyltransferase
VADEGSREEERRDEFSGVSYTELMLGCRACRDKRIRFEGVPETFQDLKTLDVDPDVGADYVHDLCVTPYPFEDNSFDEIHAYEVLEHCGQQGDWKLFFAQFTEFWRILKPGGYFCATVPMWDSPWAWGDPSHTRVITAGTISYLDQDHYEQVGVTSTSDFRGVWKGNFHVTGMQEQEHQFCFVLKAIK